MKSSSLAAFSMALRFSRIFFSISGFRTNTFSLFSKDKYTSPFQKKTKKLTSETIKKVYSKLPYLINAKGKAIFSGFANCHTHFRLTLAK